MAAATETGDQVVQAWLPLPLPTELREHAAGAAEMWQLTCTRRFDRLHNVLMCWFEPVPTLDESILTWAKAKVLTW